MISPILIILLPTVALARRFVARRRVMLQTPTPESDQTWLSISGNNKLDILRLKPEQLIAVSAANNYVTIYYQENDRLQKRLLRSSLKKIHAQLPMLIRAHRSHLIHALHFRAWANASTLSLTYLEIPVAQSYKAEVMNRLKSV